MQRQPVTSSSVLSVGYDAASQTLEVEFVNGSIYQYFDVPAPVHHALMTTESVGRFLNDQIRGVYRYVKV